MNDSDSTLAELRRKLHAAHRELARRHRRDQELAHYMPAIAARMQSLAADATLDLRGPDPAWARDPEIDWSGIEGGHPTGERSFVELLGNTPAARELARAIGGALKWDAAWTPEQLIARIRHLMRFEPL